MKRRTNKNRMPRATRHERKVQSRFGLILILISVIFAYRIKALDYENWFLILGGIIPGIYCIFTKLRVLEDPR